MWQIFLLFLYFKQWSTIYLVSIGFLKCLLKDCQTFKNPSLFPCMYKVYQVKGKKTICYFWKHYICKVFYFRSRVKNICCLYFSSQEIDFIFLCSKSKRSRQSSILIYGLKYFFPQKINVENNSVADERATQKNEAKKTCCIIRNNLHIRKFKWNRGKEYKGEK